MINIINRLIKYIDKGDSYMITLEQVDEVIERTGASYSEAKSALEETNGNVLEAIIKIESGTKKSFKKSRKESKNSKFNEYTDEFMAKMKEIVKLGNITKISVKKNEVELVNLPMTAGAVGAIVFPPAILTGIVAALATGGTLEITKVDGEVISINEITEDTINTLKSKINIKKDKDIDLNMNDDNEENQ